MHYHIIPVLAEGSAEGVTQESSCHHELGHKTVANAFWNFQVEEELREARDIERCFQGGVNVREEYMQIIDLQRAKSPYPHECDSKECKSRGQCMLYNFYNPTKITINVYSQSRLKIVILVDSYLEMISACVLVGILKFIQYTCSRNFQFV